ncbi:hypothetical protein BC831DRAFT_208958 [Entophlyctis helioformis]|nr:hypothetical protein BC831DRAFT_208958 [Entophlyctis helioformis]
MLRGLRLIALFNHADLSGSIPDVFSSLANLTYLDLSHNALSGPLPLSLSAASSLSHLGVASNRVSGSIPWNITQAFPLLTHLDLSGTFVSDQIPNLTSLQSLRYCNMTASYLCLSKSLPDTAICAAGASACPDFSNGPGPYSDPEHPQTQLSPTLVTALIVIGSMIGIAMAFLLILKLVQSYRHQYGGRHPRRGLLAAFLSSTPRSQPDNDGSEFKHVSIVLEPSKRPATRPMPPPIPDAFVAGDATLVGEEPPLGLRGWQAGSNGESNAGSVSLQSSSNRTQYATGRIGNRRDVASIHGIKRNASGTTDRRHSVGVGAKQQGPRSLHTPSLWQHRERWLRRSKTVHRATPLHRPILSCFIAFQAEPVLAHWDRRLLASRWRNLCRRAVAQPHCMLAWQTISSTISSTSL